jgi:signal peptidase
MLLATWQTKEWIARFFKALGICLAVIVAISTCITIISAGKVNPLGVSVEVVTSGSMAPAINTGDLVIVADEPDDSYSVGDVVTYVFSEDGRLVTHRLVAKSTDGTFTIKGDANAMQDRHAVTASQFIGKVIAVIPGNENLMDAFMQVGKAQAILTSAAVVLVMAAVATQSTRFISYRAGRAVFPPSQPTLGQL